MIDPGLIGRDGERPLLGPGWEAIADASGGLSSAFRSALSDRGRGDGRGILAKSERSINSGRASPMGRALHKYEREDT